MENRIKILDCTLRDGGLGLEDAYKNRITDIGFTKKDREEIAYNLSNANLDIIELGSIEITEDDRTKYAIYQNIESISKVMPKAREKGPMFVGLFRGPDTPIEDIPEWAPGLVEGLRVIIRYSELKKSIQFCAALAQKGYKVFVQPMLTMRYTDEEINYIIDESNKMHAYALYFVDSYGYMTKDDVSRLFKMYDCALDPSIRIGFHSHNNMNLAYANVLSFIENSGDRKLIIDSCVTGMGQGAGNLQTELIVPLINNLNSDCYKYDYVLDTCEVVEKYLTDNLWGYSVTRLLPALHKTAYKYSISLRKNYGLSYRLINKIFNEMPEDLRHRYTVENVERLLNNRSISQ